VFSSSDQHDYMGTTLHFRRRGEAFDGWAHRCLRGATVGTAGPRAIVGSACKHIYGQEGVSVVEDDCNGNGKQEDRGQRSDERLTSGSHPVQSLLHKTDMDTPVQKTRDHPVPPLYPNQTNAE